MIEKTILLVQDQPEDLDLVLRALRQNGFEKNVVLCAETEGALDFLFGRGKYTERDLRNAPGLILLDLAKFRPDVMSILRHIRANPMTDTVPVTILSASMHPIDMRAAYKNGANSFVQKSSSFDELSSCISQIGNYWLKLNLQPPL